MTLSCSSDTVQDSSLLLDHFRQHSGIRQVYSDLYKHCLILRLEEMLLSQAAANGFFRIKYIREMMRTDGKYNEIGVLFKVCQNPSQEFYMLRAKAVGDRTVGTAGYCVGSG